MKAFTKNLITLAAALLSLSTLTASEIEVRFEKAQYLKESKVLFIEVQVRNTSEANLNLAGQNYRFYYDSEILSLDTEKSTSALPSTSYTDIAFEGHKKGIQADKVNQISFDDNLGFVNFSIDLHNLKDGGVNLSKDDWTAVARLKFEVKEESVAYDLVWGRDGATEKYATAFVEMQEWVSSSKLDKIDITFYGDLSSKEEATKEVKLQAKVGPNPTSDYVHITLDNALTDEATVIVRDMTGKVVKSEMMSIGDIATQVNLSDITPATYILELLDNQASTISKERIIVAR